MLVPQKIENIVERPQFINHTCANDYHSELPFLKFCHAKK